MCGAMAVNGEIVPCMGSGLTCEYCSREAGEWPAWCSEVSPGTWINMDFDRQARPGQARAGYKRFIESPGCHSSLVL